MSDKYKEKIARILTMNSNYRKNLIIFLMLASVPGIIFSFLLFYFSKSQMEKELHTVHQNYMNHTIQSIEKQFSDLEMFMANWAADMNRKDFSNLNIAQDYQTIRDIYKILVVAEGYNPMIGRLELYLNRPQSIIFSKNGYTYLNDQSDLENYNKLLTNNKTLFWDHSHHSFEAGYKNRYSPLVLVHNLDNYISDPFGSLIAFVNPEKIADLLQSPYEDGSVFLLHGDNNWLFGNNSKRQPDKLQKAILKEIKSRSHMSAPFLFHYDDIEYTVSYDNFTRLGEKWFYVSIAPMTNITSPVVFVSKIGIYSSLFVFIFAVILSLFASRKLYAPIEKLVEKTNGIYPVDTKNEFELIETKFQHLSTESKYLEKRLKKQLPYLREGYILQLLQGYLYSYNEEDIKKQMKQYGTTEDEMQYMVAYIQIFGFNQSNERFKVGDEGLVSFLATNITEETIKNFSLNADVINFHDLTIGILFSLPIEQVDKETEYKIKEFSENFINHINQICDLNVSIGLSRPTDSLKEIHSIFEETKGALSFRSLQDKNQIIEMEKMNKLINNRYDFSYPFDMEKEITHAIRLRDTDEAIKSLHAFFDNHRKQNVSEAVMKQGALKLLGSIFHIVLQTSLVENFIKNGAKLYDELYKLRDPEEMNHWFGQKVILPIIEELTEKQDHRLNLIVQKVKEMLDTKYMEDISLDYCANQVNLNPSILSKVFKEITGWNFIDYLTNVRVMTAKELLIETDTKIKDIAKKIGYQHSYFNRIFKKLEGVTPSQYRELGRKDIG